MLKKLSRERLEKDPVLRTYHIPYTNADDDYLRYDASGFFSPISIKDQIIRVCTILDSARKEGLISEKRPLLIIGGGLAGAVAAIRAAEMEIKTVLIDKGVIMKNIVTLSSRYFCPTQYDWTAAHWKRGAFVIKSLKNAADSFVLLQGQIGPRIENIETELDNKSSFITRSSQTTMISSKVIKKNRSRFLRVKYQTNPGITKPTTEIFGMALSCTGFGKEKVFIDNYNYRGVEFWSLTDHNDVIIEDDPNQKIVICGSGDGALQDYLLSIAVPDVSTVKNLYNRLKLPPRQKIDLENQINLAEQTAKRKELWFNRSNKESICKAMSELHKTHLIEVNKLLEIDDIKNRINTLLRKESDGKQFIASRINIYHECRHFSPCYPLNRFMALLISEYLFQEHGIQTIFGEKFIKSIKGFRHRCAKDNPKPCLGKKHRVTSYKQETCTSNEKNNKTTELFNTVIVRFGLDGKSLAQVFGRKPAFPGTQFIPYLL